MSIRISLPQNMCQSSNFLLLFIVVFLGRMQSRECQSRGFLESVHDIERLDGLTGSPFHQIIDRADNDQTIRIRIFLKTDIAEIRPDKQFRFGVTVNAFALLHDADKRLAAVFLSVKFPNLFFFEIFF